MAVLQSTLRISVLDQASARLRAISAQLTAFQRNTRTMMAPLTTGLGGLVAFGGAYLGVTAGMRGTIGAAMEFETAFADVRKVVEASDEQFKNIRNQIRGMSRELPLTAVEISQLFAAAGESGIAVEDLKSFSEMAARVGIAFDMSAGEAGESLAKLKAQLGLNVEETGLMADAINHLSNKMASKAPQITEFMLRVGKFAEMGGFHRDQVAAIGSAMISAGAEAETAGTAMLNVVRKMTTGQFAKKDQREAAKALGLDLPTLAKQMKKDAPKALKSVLQAIAKAPEHQQIALLSKFFGDEARAFAPLIGNIGLLDQALDSVADRSQYAGSAFQEYVQRASTTSNVLQILRNKIAYVFEDMGNSWLPTIKEAAAGLGHVLDTLGMRAGIFDEIGASFRGFVQGLGFDGGVRQAIEGLGDLIFGKVDGSGAADRLGGLFRQFESYGESVRKFADAVKDNPVVKFLGEIVGSSTSIMAAVIGLSILGGTLWNIGRALAFITGLSAAVGILKSIAKFGAGALGLVSRGTSGGVDAIIPDGDGKTKGGGKQKGPPAKPDKPSLPKWITEGAKSSAPGVVAGLTVAFKGAVAKVAAAAATILSSPFAIAAAALAATGAALVNTTPRDPSMIDPDRQAEAQRYHKEFGPGSPYGGMGYEGGRHRAGVGAGPKPGDDVVPPLPQSRGDLPAILKTEQVGTANVNVVNPIRPNVSVSVTVNATTNASPVEIGNQVGAAVRAEVEGSYTDGGV